MNSGKRYDAILFDFDGAPAEVAGAPHGIELVSPVALAAGDPAFKTAVPPGKAET